MEKETPLAPHEKRLATVASICISVVIGVILITNIILDLQDISLAPSSQQTTLSTNTQVPVAFRPPSQCDVNEDGVVDIADVIAIGEVLTNNAQYNGDCNGDGLTTQADQIALLTYLFYTLPEIDIKKDARDKLSSSVALAPTLTRGTDLTCDRPFIRGDFNTDADVNVFDAVGLLNYLFVEGAPQPDCTARADVNADNTVNIADPLYLLNYLFEPNAPQIPTPNMATGPGY